MILYRVHLFKHELKRDNVKLQAHVSGLLMTKRYSSLTEESPSEFRQIDNSAVRLISSTRSKIIPEVIRAAGTRPLPVPDGDTAQDFWSLEILLCLGAIARKHDTVRTVTRLF